MTTLFTFLGSTLIATSLAASIAAVVGMGFAERGYTVARRLARIVHAVGLTATLLALGFLAALFVAQRYDIAYVAAYSSNELPIPFRVAALWAGQPGSLLLWALSGLLVAGALARQHTEDTYAPGVALLPVIALLCFTLILNPFAPNVDATGTRIYPQDGSGLNELLYNPWMIIHPPMLFAGYALLVAPFALGVSALLRGGVTGWTTRALPWALAGWSVLLLALMLGGYWSYETLGWGGYWGWDPVENSALVPWLITTGLLHTMLISRRRSGLERTTLVLALLQYLAVFYATYLARSGVLADFSVHTFALEAIQPAMTLALGLLIAGSVGVLVWRWRAIPHVPMADALLSRDSMIVLMVIGLLVIAGITAFATSVPLISAIPTVGYGLQAMLGGIFPLDDGSRFTQGMFPLRDGRFSLTADFYNTTLPLFGLFVIALLAVGPLLSWRDTSYRRLLRALRWPLLSAVGLTCAAVLLGVRAWMPLAYLSLSGFALGTNIVMLIGTVRRGLLRIGGYLAHIGAALLLAGIVASVGFASREERVVLVQGEPVHIFNTELTFNGRRTTPEKTTVLELTTSGGGRTTRATPLLHFIPRRNATLITPAIRNELLRDVYITPIQYKPPEDPNAALFGRDSTREVGPYTLTIRSMQLPGNEGGEAQVTLQAAFDNRTINLPLTARVEVNDDGQFVLAQSKSVSLSGGHTASIFAVSPQLGQVIIRVEGLNLPVVPASAEVLVSVKPGMLLVWGGIIICVLGGFIALLRRSREHAALVSASRRVGDSHPAPQPRLRTSGASASNRITERQ